MEWDEGGESLTGTVIGHVATHQMVVRPDATSLARLRAAERRVISRCAACPINTLVRPSHPTIGSMTARCRLVTVQIGVDHLSSFKYHVSGTYKSDSCGIFCMDQSGRLLPT